MQESFRSARRQRVVAVVAPPLIVIGFVLALFDSMQRRRDSTEAVQQTHRVIGHLDALRTRLADAETGQRGYILSADTAYLRPYRHAAADAGVLLGRLRRETGDIPAQQRSLDTLDVLVATRFTLLEGRISTLRDEGAEAARLGLVASGGREVMDEIRRVLGAMDRTERRLLERREAAQEAYGRQVLWTMLAGAALVAGVALLTNALFTRQARELEELNDELQQSNAILQEQAAELEVQAEELQTQFAHQQEMMAELEAGSEEVQAQRTELERLAAQLATANRDLEVANGELQQRTEEAEAANRAKTDFLSAMSHELRTPLNAIAGYVDLMDLGVHGPLTGAQQTCLERIRHNEHHLLTLITDILNFARIEAGRIEVRPADVPVAELLDEVAAVVEPLVAERGLALRTTPCGPVAHVRGDRDRIAQILLNLLSNAVKCTDAGGEIHLACESGGARTAIHVRDTGRGIAPDRHEAIFEPFVQVTPERTLAQGVGLGLSISRDLARAMGGELSVQSAPGEGSTFTLTLPTAVRIAVERIVHEDERLSTGPQEVGAASPPVPASDASGQGMYGSAPRAE